jgi:hypothetical protein
VAAHQPEDPQAVRDAARRHVRVTAWNWLLVLPLIAVLLPWFYNREDPKLFDIPFFYWYQLAAIAIGVLSTLVVYRATRGDR